MRKIGDKSSILSPITGFQTQKPFRKPSDSSPQEPATILNNSWMKASLRWRGSIKVGSIGLRSKKVSSANKCLKAGRLSIWDLAIILSSKQIILDSLKKRPVKADYFGQFEKEARNRHIEEAVELYQQWYGIVMKVLGKSDEN